MAYKNLVTQQATGACSTDEGALLQGLVLASRDLWKEDATTETSIIRLLPSWKD